MDVGRPPVPDTEAVMLIVAGLSRLLVVVLLLREVLLSLGVPVSLGGGVPLTSEASAEASSFPLAVAFAGEAATAGVVDKDKALLFVSTTKFKESSDFDLIIF